MKKYLLMTAGAFILFGLFVLAETASEKIDGLKKKRAEAAMQLYNRRIKIIEDDPKLKEIHDKIMSLHKELALRLENDREVIELSTRIRDIDAEVEKLSDQAKKEEKKDDKKEEGNKDKDKKD
ncbi:MAG TPA: hypothetical protein DCZ94_10980 [Lentisphaeria bacterium]|nr:MAG: hypothetical protein A2X48_06860 [Lentisphaerae bacterium GWF2_49_21]HBC87468.1 hypothetical protein [Lentisphaeria bacterium]